LEKNFSGIEKVLTTFSISKKIFSKLNGLICALMAHINRTLLTKHQSNKKLTKT